MMNTEIRSTRPIVYDYQAPHLFLKDLMAFYNGTRSFSLRERTKELSGCSQALVSQILAGRRNLTRDQLPSIGRIFELTSAESAHIDQRLTSRFMIDDVPEIKPKTSQRIAKNHLLAAWHHPYVKDLVHLRGFRPELSILQQMLYGVLSLEQIKKSRDFLLQQGFWRKSMSGRVVPEEQLTITTHGIPNEKIKDFHKRALKIALDGMDKFPATTRRMSSTTLIAVREKSTPELRALISEFHERLQKFVDEHECTGTADELIQVTMHLTPCGAKYEPK